MACKSALKTPALTTLCFFVLTFIGYSSSSDAATKKDTKPNIVFIVLDDLDSKVTEPFLYKVLPFTMSLKSEGVYFKNAFSSTPLCCPARATIFTGKYAHNTRVLRNHGENGGYEEFRNAGNEEHTIATLLEREGYKTAAFGKYLNGYAENNRNQIVPVGWTWWSVFARGPYYTGYNYSLLQYQKNAQPIIIPYGSQEQDYSTDVIAKNALDFISLHVKKKDESPFFMYIASTAPHSPLRAAPRHRALEKTWVGTFPKNRSNYFRDGSTAQDKPYWLRIGWDLRRSYEERLDDIWVARLSSLYAVDDMVRGLVGSLKKNKLWDNTLLVITSDNGFSLGAHRLLAKKVPYEESIHVPLLIASGKNVPIKRGAVDSHYVLLCDHAATFLDLAHAKENPDMDGRSLMPILTPTSNNVPWRNNFLIEFGGDLARAETTESIEASLDDDDVMLMPTRAEEFRVPSYAGLRGRTNFVQGSSVLSDYLYVEWNDPRYKDARGVQRKEYELYNLKEDPDELNNLLYFDPQRYKELQNRLQQKLDALKACVGKGCQKID